MPDPSVFAADALFDLEGYAHARLFEVTLHAWEALDRLARYLAERTAGAGAGSWPGAHVTGDVVVGRGTIIEPGAFVQGPAWIGEGCQIRAHAYLRGNVLVGDRCVIGSSELKTTILMDDAHAAHFNYCGDSILGKGTNLGAGTKLANLRLDRKTVTVALGDRRIDSGLRKFGAILGDGAQTGCNSVLNPGTVLARGAVVLPCRNVGGYVPARADRKGG